MTTSALQAQSVVKSPTLKPNGIANLQNTKKFDDVSILELLFNDLPPNQSICITCIKPSKQIHNKFFVDIAQANVHAQANKKFSNVYFGCSTLLTDIAKTLGANKRVKKEHCAGTFGVWLEVDVNASGFSDKGNPCAKTLKEALDLIKDMPFEPTLISLSGGGGIHCFWKFNKFFVVTDDVEHAQIDSLVYSWWSIADELAKKRGWKIDNVSDLPRVLRVNNTLNHKTDPPRQTNIHDYQPKNIYTLKQIQGAIGELTPRPNPNDSKAKTKTDKVSTSGSRFDLNPNASPDVINLETLLEVSHKAKLSWNYKRSDFTDQSPSQYDDSLAVCALKAGWTEQETVNLLIAFRRKHKKDLKLRDDYYAGTIADAKLKVRNDKLKLESQTPTFKTLDEGEGVEQLTTTTQAIVIDECNDIANGRRFNRQHGSDVRYCVELKKWFVYDGKRWLKDSLIEIERRAKRTAIAIAREAAEATDSQENTQLLRHAQKTKQAKGINDMLAMAKSELPIPIQASAFDKDLMLLNCRNGTLDLRTSELRAHKREDLLTKLVDANYDANAKCPTWLAFLERIMDSDAEMIAFLRRAVGYSLTGEVNERAVFILIGIGANGKSVFSETIRALMNDYAEVTPPSAVMKKQSGDATNDVAKLMGARFVTINETEKNGRLDESAIKAMSGDDMITARLLHQEFVDFNPNFKVWMRTNNEPDVRGTDEGIWDRLKKIDFSVRIPREQQDKNLLKKLRKEFSGILEWAVAGCLEWQANGLGVPQKVESSTLAYRNEQNTLAQFINDCCILGADNWASSASLRIEYEAFCRERGERADVRGNEFGVKLRALGCKEHRGRRGRGWDGIGLLDSTD